MWICRTHKDKPRPMWQHFDDYQSLIFWIGNKNLHIRKQKRDNMGGMRKTYQQSNNEKNTTNRKLNHNDGLKRADILSIPCLGKP